MSRSRWPDSINSPSDIPGTIQCWRDCDAATPQTHRNLIGYRTVLFHVTQEYIRHVAQFTNDVPFRPIRFYSPVDRFEGWS